MQTKQWEPPLLWHVHNFMERSHRAAGRWPAPFRATYRVCTAAYWCATNKYTLRRVYRVKGGTEVWRGRNVGTPDITVFRCTPIDGRTWRVEIPTTFQDNDNGDLPCNVVRTFTLEPNQTLRQALWQEWLDHWD